MDLNRFDTALRAFAASAGRRDAVRSLGALGLGLLAALGLKPTDAAATDTRRRKRRGRQRDQEDAAPGPTDPTPPDASDAEPATGTHEPSVAEPVVAQARKKRPKRGPAGPAGPTGPTGATGPAPPDLFTEFLDIPATLNATRTIDLTCTDLESRVLGGGFDTGVEGSQSGDITVNAALPTSADGDTPEGFRVTFTRTGTASGGPISVTAFVLCTPA
jgi:hypothetical protein